MKIFDCFIFNHEVELLEIRFNILNDYVDKFIITEGDTTFSGNLKESHFLKNKDKFLKWQDKIVLNSITIPSNLENPWDREIYSRNSVMNLDLFQNDDVLLTSDGDEIPNPEVIKYVEDWISNGTHFTFQQNGYHGYLNNLYTDMWFGTRAASYEYMKNTTVDNIRESTEDESKITGSIITNGGWHFSYCGDEEHIKQKINSFCDRHYDVPEITNFVFDNLKHGKDVLNRSHIKYRKVKVDESFPEYISSNQERYSHLLLN
jgi:beta-1,4-mannosyl-glycoprotein beta-1,4-N-acetylglucosaminyltransferase